MTKILPTMFTPGELDAFVPMGVLRAGIVVAPVASAFFAAKDRTGVAHGVTIDLFRAFAATLRLPLEMQLFPNSGLATDAVESGACDISFMPRDASREGRVDFGPAYVMITSTYLVPKGSPLRSIEEVNRPGMRIVAIANTTTSRSAARTAPLASVEEVAGVDVMTARAKACDGHAFALSNDSFVGMLPGLPGARVLPGYFQQTGVCVAVPKGRPHALALASRLVEDAKRSGLIRDALDAAGFTDLPAAASTRGPA